MTDDRRPYNRLFDDPAFEAEAELETAAFKKLLEPDEDTPQFSEIDPEELRRECEYQQWRDEEAGHCNLSGADYQVADAYALKFYNARRTTNFKGPLKPRQNIYGSKLYRGTVSAIVGHGGTAKSTLALLEAAAMASGRQLAHDKPLETLRVLYVNYEDSVDEMSLRVAGLLKVHRLATADFYEDVQLEQGSRLTYISGLDVPLILANTEDRKPNIIEKNWYVLTHAIRRLKADVLVIDPLISAHLLNENDNNAIDLLIKRLSLLASRLNIAIVVVHHSRKAKTGGEDDHADAARGASSFIDAVRGSRRVERMSATDAKALGISEDQRHRYFKTTSTKANFAAVGEAEWYRLALPTVAENVDPLRPGGSVVAVATPWQIPAGKSTSATGWKTDMAMIRAVQAVVRKAEAAGQPYQRDKSAKNSIVPHLYGPLGIDPSATKPAASTQVNERLGIWLADGWLREVDVPTSGRRRKTTAVLSVGNEAVDPTAPTDIPDHLGE